MLIKCFDNTICPIRSEIIGYSRTNGLIATLSVPTSSEPRSPMLYSQWLSLYSTRKFSKANRSLANGYQLWNLQMLYVSLYPSSLLKVVITSAKSHSFCLSRERSESLIYQAKRHFILSGKDYIRVKCDFYSLKQMGFCEKEALFRRKNVKIDNI